MTPEELDQMRDILREAISPIQHDLAIVEEAFTQIERLLTLYRRDLIEKR